MKSRVLLIPFFILAVLVGAASCKRCVTCKVKDAVGNTINYGAEKCGTKNEIEQYEKDLLEGYYCKTFTVKDSDGVTILVTQQICGTDATMKSADSALYWTFIADSPSVSSTRLENKVYCVK